jgi:SAM-dependent methyltransferase
LYVAFHAKRFAFLLQLLCTYITDDSRRVLDIGPSKLTALIAQTLGVRVDSLGFTDDPHAAAKHFGFDLNDAQDPARWRADIGPYDIIVMAEVIEHLHTSPTRVLAFLRTLLAPDGILIIQTPNAAALHKRLKLLGGRNPYELIREDVTNPGHFREYTARELRWYAEEANLTVERCSHENYFDYRFPHKAGLPPRARGYLALVNAGYRLLPPTLRPCITCVLRRPVYERDSAAKTP